MKHFYIILDYSKLSSDPTQHMEGVSNQYLESKQKQTSPAVTSYRSKLVHAFSSEFTGDGIICDLSVPGSIANAIAGLRTRLEILQRREEPELFFTKAVKYFVQKNAQVKILIMGHGRHGESGCLVDSSAPTANPLLSIESVARDVVSITREFYCFKIDWHIKLCVCYAARSPTLTDQAIHTFAQRTRGSLADRLGFVLARIGLQNFTLTSYFTPVAIQAQTGHLSAWRERAHQLDVRAKQLLTRAQTEYLDGYRFWSAIGENEALQQIPVNKILIETSHIAISALLPNGSRVLDIFSLSVQTEYKTKFFHSLDLILSDASITIQEQMRAELMQISNLDPILFYRFAEIQAVSSSYSTARNANKSILTYKNRKLHSECLRREQ